MINKLCDLIDKKKEKVKRIAIAVAEDEAVLKAVQQAVNKQLVEPVFIGKRDQIREICDKIHFDVHPYEIIDIEKHSDAAFKAVDLVRNNSVELLMKGKIATKDLLKAVIHKEQGIKKRKVLSHIALFEIEHYHKLLGITDAAMNIAPGLDEKVDIIKNAVELFSKAGNEKPKVAALSAVELVNPSIPSSLDAAVLSRMNHRNQIKSCYIEGPLALDNAVSKSAAQTKGLTDEVSGDADILLVPDIDAGNVLYKSLNFLAKGRCAALIMGAKVPVVLTSRADSEDTKLMSIALAAYL